jgi:putative transposase
MDPRVLVVSRNNFTPDTNESVQKLSNRDIERIIKQWKKGKPIPEIANYFGITRQWVYKLIKEYKNSGTYPILQKPGRRRKEIAEETRIFILAIFHAHLVGPVLLEKKIEEVHGIHIPHNTIYQVLLDSGCIDVNVRKRKQRKWVRFEREHSMSLWQGDWKQVTIDCQVKWLIAFMDDSSRLITCYGIFDSPTTENTLLVLRMGFAQYGIPREILTDHGTQFVSARDRDNASHIFKEFLDFYGIKHIIARIKHPQTNGKIERFFGEVERRLPRFGSIDKIIVWHNEVKPHSSLDYDEPYHAFWYRLPPERILGYVKEWFYV